MGQPRSYEPTLISMPLIWAVVIAPTIMPSTTTAAAGAGWLERLIFGDSTRLQQRRRSGIACVDRPSCGLGSLGGGMTFASRSNETAPVMPAHRDIRRNWTREEALALYEAPFNDLLFQAQTVHRKHFDPNKVQLSRLLSIKTGGCPEDCGYCSQSIHHDSSLKAS